MAISYSYAKVNTNDVDPSDYLILEVDDSGSPPNKIIANITDGYWQTADKIADALNAFE